MKAKYKNQHHPFFATVATPTKKQKIMMENNNNNDDDIKNTTGTGGIKVPATITVNPILKKEPHQHYHGPSSPSRAAKEGVEEDDDDKMATTPGREKKHLTWDEHAIEEHDLLRGTRMKIDEPNTPYTHYDHHSDDESHSSGIHPRSPDENHPKNSASAAHQNSLATQWTDISSKLQAVADKRDACTLSPAPSRDSNMSDSEDETARQKKKDHEKKFKDMRKKHYNEAEMMRRWRADHANDDEEEEEEDGDDTMKE